MTGFQSLMHPEVWREKITEKFMKTTKFLDTLPIERKLAKEVVYFVQKTLAITPERFAWGGPVPFSMGTYERETTTPELYGYGVEMPKIDIDLLPFGWNTIRREVEQKAKGMGLYLDKKISDAMIAAATTEVDASSGKWTTATNIQPDVSEAIKSLEDLNIDLEDMMMVLSPTAHMYVLNSLTTISTTVFAISPPGVVTGNRVTEYLGLPVRVSPNMGGDVANGDTSLIFGKNEFGWLNECYPMTTKGPDYIGEIIGNPKVYRAEMWAMNIPVIDQPDAIVKITEVF